MTSEAVGLTFGQSTMLPAPPLCRTVNIYTSPLFGLLVTYTARVFWVRGLASDSFADNAAIGVERRVIFSDVSGSLYQVSTSCAGLRYIFPSRFANVGLTSAASRVYTFCHFSFLFEKGCSSSKVKEVRMLHRRAIKG